MLQMIYLFHLHHRFTHTTRYTRCIVQKGEASPALVPAERRHPTYTLFARCDNPPNILGVRHILQKNIYSNKPADIGNATMVWFVVVQ